MLARPSLRSPLHAPARATSFAALVLVAAWLPSSACKRRASSCEPDQHSYELVRVELQAAAALNLDDEGNPLPTVVKVAQLSGDLALRNPDFAELWDDPDAALGDELIEIKELQIYPDSAEQLELVPDPQARFVLAFAGFQQPVGSTWYRIYRLPDRYGEQVCAQIEAGEDPGSLGPPCFYLMLERNEIDGGAQPSPGFDLARVAGACAPPAG